VVMDSLLAYAVGVLAGVRRGRSIDAVASLGVVRELLVQIVGLIDEEIESYRTS